MNETLRRGPGTAPGAQGQAQNHRRGSIGEQWALALSSARGRGWSGTPTTAVHSQGCSWAGGAALWPFSGEGAPAGSQSPAQTGRAGRQGRPLWTLAGHSAAYLPCLSITPLLPGTVGSRACGLCGSHGDKVQQVPPCWGSCFGRPVLNLHPAVHRVRGQGFVGLSGDQTAAARAATGSG